WRLSESTFLSMTASTRVTFCETAVRDSALTPPAAALLSGSSAGASFMVPEEWQPAAITILIATIYADPRGAICSNMRRYALKNKRFAPLREKWYFSAEASKKIRISSLDRQILQPKEAPLADRRSDRLCPCGPAERPRIRAGHKGECRIETCRRI